MIKSSCLFDTIILWVSVIAMIFVSPASKIIVFSIYLAYIYFSNNSVINYIYCFIKSLLFLIPVFLISFLIMSIIDVFILNTTIAFLISGLCEFVKKYSSMEIYLAYSYILSPMGFIGINPNRWGWTLARFLRNVKIYRDIFSDNLTNDFSIDNNFKNKSFCDKISSSKHKVKTIRKIARLKILQLDQMMTIRLFDVDYYRSNYYKTNVKIINFIFLVGILGLLISEVII